jgi:nicotinate-nucleotide pyrophosphorylase
VLKIQRIEEGEYTVFALSGRIEAENLKQLKSLLKAERQPVMLDLREVSLVAREVVSFLARCQEDDIGLRNCPAYVREWIAGERGEK